MFFEFDFIQQRIVKFGQGYISFGLLFNVDQRCRKYMYNFIR